MIANEDGFWFAFKERADGKVDFEFFRYERCVCKGWAGSIATMIRLFDDMVRRCRAESGDH